MRLQDEFRLIVLKSTEMSSFVSPIETVWITTWLYFMCLFKLMNANRISTAKILDGVLSRWSLKLFVFSLGKSDPKKSVCSIITLRQGTFRHATFTVYPWNPGCKNFHSVKWKLHLRISNDKPLLLLTLEVQVRRIFTAKIERCV